ncbi:hypothetical protein BDFB_004915 [Asbolus verrucosus]|uniref:Uncharacterized protein n=1 Tax=Asbolus verrucosus TaxID=1661398 RepID=A0A482VET6_ASBVE|nr:hypothetical protein BDFB_004915 [Asbolus verrucosus]
MSNNFIIGLNETQLGIPLETQQQQQGYVEGRVIFDDGAPPHNTCEELVNQQKDPTEIQGPTLHKKKYKKG